MRLFFAALILSSLLFPLAAKPSTDLVKAYKQAFKEFTANQKSPQAIMKLALASFDAGYFKQAYDLVLQYLEIKPDDAKALVLYSNVLIEYGYEAKARRKLALIIDLYPGSEEAEKAQQSVEMLDRLHNPTQKQFSFKTTAGIDSNPAHMMDNDYLAIFSTALHCDNNTSDKCDYMHRFDSANPYVEMEAKSNYIYDAGDTGGLFLTYGLGMASRMYVDNIDAGHLSLYLNYGLGYSWGKSSFRIPFTLKQAYTKYKLAKDGSRFDYFTFKVNPHYRYRFDSKALLSLGLDHEEQDSQESFQYKSNNYIEYRQNKFFAFMRYQSNPSYTFPFSIKIYRGDQSNWNDYYDNNYSMPYTQYDFSGLDLTFDYKASPQKSYKAALKFGKRWFHDHYIPNTYPVPPGDERVDYTAMLDFQSISVNKKLSKTVLGYKFYTNESNYEPLNFTKHELYMGFYWLP